MAAFVVFEMQTASSEEILIRWKLKLKLKIENKKNRMTKKLKLSALALMVAAAAVTAQAQDTLLQAVSVNFTFYSQGKSMVTSSGNTNNFVDHQGFGIKDLIKALGVSYVSGDVLARSTPTPIYTTNIVPGTVTNLIITNISTSTEIVSNAILFLGASNYIGDTNVTFGTNIVLIGGVPVTLGTNYATVGTNLVLSPASTAAPMLIGTNTTVTTTNLTNAAGFVVGTNYTFVNNTVNVVTTNKTGPGTWVIYNTGTKTTTPIPTNVFFDIHTEVVYKSPTNLAYMHGETIKHDGEIDFGSTDEIRALVLSNSTTQIRLDGYAHGHLVPVSLGTTATAPVVYSQDYHWFGNGSGLISNTVPSVISGEISEGFFKLLK